MQATTATPSPRKRRGRWGLILLLVLAAACLLAVAGYWLLVPVQAPAALLVRLEAPQEGALLDLSVPVEVGATADSDSGVRRIEVYADGFLVGYQETTLGTGSNPLITLQTWLPTALGRHVLMARAYEMDGRIADSTAVTVDVVETTSTTGVIDVDRFTGANGVDRPSLNEVADALGTPPERLGEMNPGLSGTDPASPLPPGTRLLAPRPPVPAPAPTLPPPPVPGAPTPPVGSGRVISCSTAELSWPDVPDDAGYAIYRWGPGESSFRAIVRPPADTTSFRDPSLGTPGIYRYFVAAVVRGLESPGPIFSIDSIGTCAGEGRAAPTAGLTLSLISLDTSEAFDGIYCYVRVLDSPTARIPASDHALLLPDSDGLTYSLQRQLPGRGLYALPTLLAGAPISLETDCWGRRGVEAISLGRVTASHLPEEWDGRDLLETALLTRDGMLAGAGGKTLGDAVRAGGYNYRLRYRIGNTASGGLEGLIDPNLLTVIQLPESLVPVAAAGLAIPAPQSPRFGRVPAGQVRDASSGGGMGTLVESTRYADGLAWDWFGNDQWNESNITGYQITVTFIDRISPYPQRILLEETVIGGSRKSWPLPTLPGMYGCNADIIYEVRASAGPLLSEPTWITVFTPQCRQFARVAVTLQTLTLSGLDDRGDFCFIFCPRDEHSELWGSVTVNELSMRPIGSLDPNDDCKPALGNGSHDLSGIYFAQYQSGYPFSRVTGFGRVNTIYRHFRDSAQTLTVTTSLMEADPPVFGYCFLGSDNMILHTLELPARSLVEWARFNASVNPSGTIMARPTEGDAGIPQGNASLIYEIQGASE